jgi:hypothetical protein
MAYKGGVSVGAGYALVSTNTGRAQKNRLKQMGRQLKRRSKKRIAGRMENGGSRPGFLQHGLSSRLLLHPLVVACVHSAKLPVLVLGARLYFTKTF